MPTPANNFFLQWSEYNRNWTINKDRKHQKELEKQCWSEPFMDSDNSMETVEKHNSASSDAEINYNYSEEIEIIVEENEEITQEKSKPNRKDHFNSKSEQHFF